MTPFEKVMESSCEEYLTSKTAYVQFRHPKMRMAGYIGKQPGFVQVAKAPYDIDGYYMDGALFIACEVKENGDEHHDSMKIIAPKKKGTGLQYHQLEALVRAHEAGGLACVVWNNNGDIGFLDGSRLKAAKSAMDTSLKAEKMGLPNQKGSRSIKWGNFAPVKVNSRGIPLWLPPLPAKPAAPVVGLPKLRYDEEAGAVFEEEVVDDGRPINDDDTEDSDAL